MATTIERMGAVVEALLNKTVESEQLLRIANRFAEHWQAEFDVLVLDPESPTNAELAGFFLLKVKKFGQDILHAAGSAEAVPAAKADVELAGDAAAADLEG